MPMNLKQQLEQVMNSLDGLRASTQRLFERVDEVEALETRAAAAYEAIEHAERLTAERAELERVLPELRVQRDVLQQEVGTLSMAVNDLRRILKAAAA